MAPVSRCCWVMPPDRPTRPCGSTLPLPVVTSSLTALSGKSLTFTAPLLERIEVASVNVPSSEIEPLLDVASLR